MRSDIDQVIGLLKADDRNSLDKAISLLQQSVFSFSMRVCGQQQDAEDTMQEVLVKAVPYLTKFDNAGALAKWLYKVAKNRCLMSRRRSKFAPKQELSLEELMPEREELERLNSSENENPENSAIRGQLDQRLREAIRKLPPPYRIVLVLHDMEGFTDEEAAEITGLRPGTIRVRLHRARLFVRKELANIKGGAKKNRAETPHASVRTSSRSGRCRRIFAGLSDYLDGQLDEFSCEEIEAHLKGCEPCQKFLRSLEASVQQCRQSPADCPDPQQAAALRKQVLSIYSRALATSDR